jgi:hypothetical protein
MATTTSTRASDKEIQARAKMASFIDRVIDIIESTPKDAKKAAQERSKVTRRVARPAMR